MSFASFFHSVVVVTREHILKAIKGNNIATIAPQNFPPKSTSTIVSFLFHHVWKLCPQELLMGSVIDGTEPVVEDRNYLRSYLIVHYYTLNQIKRSILESRRPLSFTNHHNTLCQINRAKIMLILCSLNPALIWAVSKQLYYLLIYCVKCINLFIEHKCLSI